MDLKERAKQREAMLIKAFGNDYEKAMGNLIVPLFYTNTGHFNPNNRLSGYGELLRQFAIDDLLLVTPVDNPEKHFSLMDEEEETECLYRSLFLHDDYKIAHISHSYVKDYALAVDVYTLIIYKNRGRIEKFLKNQEPITEKECEKLLAAIERFGYAFDV